MPADDDCLDGAGGFRHALRLSHWRWSAFTPIVSSDGEIIDEAGLSARSIDRRGFGQMGDDETAKSASVLADQNNGIAGVGNELGEKRRLNRLRIGRRAPERRLVALIDSPSSVANSTIQGISSSTARRMFISQPVVPILSKMLYYDITQKGC